MDENKGLNILIVNTDLPIFPARGGHEYLISTHLARLANRVAIVSQLHTREQKEKSQCLTNAGIELFLWESPNLFDEANPPSIPKRTWFRQVGRDGINFFKTMSGIPKDSLLHDLQFRNIACSLDSVLQSQWQVLTVIQSDRAKYLDYLPKFPLNVLVMHDIRSLVYERRARTTSNYLNKLEFFLEAFRYRVFEGKYCRKYDLVVTVSSTDEKWVMEHYHPKNLLTIPLMVDPDYFSPINDIQEIPGRIIFTGMMNHPPNVNAAIYYAKQVFPVVQQAVSYAEFWIVGRDPTPEVLALSVQPGIHVTGLVPDIRPYMAEASIFVVPLRFGSGMRQKILEAWGMQKAVLSTSIGAEGIDYQIGENILIADSARDLAEATIKLIKDPSLSSRIRQQGKEVILQQHNPTLLTEKYYRVLRTVLAAKKGCLNKRVLIDLRWMLPGVAGGIENLSRSLVKELANFETTTQFTILAPAKIKYDLGINTSKNFYVIPVDGPGYYLNKLIWRVKRFLHNRLHMDFWRSDEVEQLRRANSYNADVALSIPGYIFPDLNSITNVLVVPDIQHEYLPDFFAPAELEERRRIYTDSINRAVRLIAISEFTRHTLIERLGIRPEKVITAPLAADPIFQHSSPRNLSTEAVLKKYKLESKQYFLYPSNTWKHKNHRTAFYAFNQFIKKTNRDVLLVCTGSLKNAQDELTKLLDALQLKERVNFLGYCPQEDLPGLYKGALGIIFPSYFEGFGMPILEAMWSDCPVICSNTTSLPEIVGEAAILCNPDSPAEFSTAMKQIVEGSALRSELIKKGRIQAAKFSWEKFTRQILLALEITINEKYCQENHSSLSVNQFRRKDLPKTISRVDRAQYFALQAQENKRLSHTFGIVVQFLKCLFTAPEVAFYALIYPALLRNIRRLFEIHWGRKIIQYIKAYINQFRVNPFTKNVDHPETIALRNHTELWSDAWAGPYLTISKEIHDRAEQIIVNGWIDIECLGKPLDIEISVDQKNIGRYRLKHTGEFSFSMGLDRSIQPGIHNVEFKSYQYFVPHLINNSNDYRPLCYKILDVKFIHNNS